MRIAFDFAADGSAMPADAPCDLGFRDAEHVHVGYLVAFD
jgi:hypothetical protein